MKHQIPTFFNLSVAIDSREITASVWQEEENFEVLKSCYIHKYPSGFFAVL